MTPGYPFARLVSSNSGKPKERQDMYKYLTAAIIAAATLITGASPANAGSKADYEAQYGVPCFVDDPHGSLNADRTAVTLWTRSSGGPYTALVLKGHDGTITVHEAPSTHVQYGTASGGTIRKYIICKPRYTSTPAPTTTTTTTAAPTTTVAPETTTTTVAAPTTTVAVTVAPETTTTTTVEEITTTTVEVDIPPTVPETTTTVVEDVTTTTAWDISTPPTTTTPAPPTTDMSSTRSDPQPTVARRSLPETGINATGGTALAALAFTAAGAAILITRRRRSL